MSHCPSCGELSDLKSHVEGTPPLNCEGCERCGGIWITAVAYSNWLDSTGGAKPSTKVKVDDLELKEGPFLRRCPDCHYILGRYKVAAELPFTIDRCNNCHGVWLDRHEWDLLKSYDLHQRLYAIFDREWQDSVRRKEQAQREEGRRKRVLGEADHARIMELRNWLGSHPQRDLLWGILLEGDAAPKT